MFIILKGASTGDLEVNRIVDELVGSFVKVRPRLVELMSTDKGSTPPSSDVTEKDMDDDLEERTDTGKRRKSARKNPIEPSHSEVDCPLCGTGFPPDRIEEHVELCLLRSDKKGSLPFNQSPRQDSKLAWKKMTKPVYNLLKDVEIKRLLNDLQLPTTGDREVHQRWTSVSLQTL